jgi:GntR family transcriptional regulator/MocR family aminotransferase
MSAGSRQELLAWAGGTGAYIIEDDYDSEYRYDINPIRPLQTVGSDENVIYVGTVSKTLSPTLRLGYLIVPHALRGVFATAKRLADRHTPSLEQEALADFLASGAYERHVRKARRRNAERRVALLEALSTKLGSSVTIVGADAGLHVVVWFNCVPRWQEAELVRRGHLIGVGLYPVTPFYSCPDVAYRPDQAGLVIGYAGLDAGEIKRGVDHLANLLKSLDGISMTVTAHSGDPSPKTSNSGVAQSRHTTRPIEDALTSPDHEKQRAHSSRSSQRRPRR